MGIADQKLSQESISGSKNAMQLFTDREDPQEAFERKLALIDRYRTDASAVLCYYGIGGIGKTALRTKLCHMINGDPECPWRLNGAIECDYAVFDFGEDGIIKDARTFMSRIKEQLEDKGYSFCLFNIALLTYAKKAGIPFDKDKSTSFILEKSPFASAIVSGLGVLPVGSWLSNAIQAIDQAAAGVRQLFYENRNKYKDELEKIYRMEAGEILCNLERYFIIDMRMNMTGAKKPLVLFLDTYEKYVDTLNSDTLKITADYWLWKGRESVIRSIPGILWVIFGRERLSWDSGDEFWKTDIPERPLNEMSPEEKEELAGENMEQHLLGDLSEKDATAYMKKAGVKDDELCHRLYETIHRGTPLFIHICIEQYKTISESRRPVTEDFGNDISELVTRYLQYMPEYYRDMSYFLAAIGSWTDELVFEIAPQISALSGFTRARYRDYAEHSFVIRKLDGTQYLHEVVRKAYLENAGEEIVRETRAVLEDILLKRLQKDDSMDLADPVSLYLENLINRNLSLEELYLRWDELFYSFRRLDGLYDHKRLIPLCERFFQYVGEKYPGSLLEGIAAAELSAYLCGSGSIREGWRLAGEYFSKAAVPEDREDKNVYRMYGSVGTVQRYAGRFADAAGLDQKSYDGLKRLLGEDHPETLLALNNLAVDYSCLGDYNRAKELKEQIFGKRVQLFGEDHPESLRALHNLAVEYGNMGDYGRARELKEQVCEKSLRLFGEDALETVNALHNLAAAYADLGDYGKAKELFEQVCEKRLRLLGEDHPDTVTAFSNLGVACSILGEYERAKDLKEQVFEKRAGLLGEDHPDTVIALNNLAADYANLGEYSRAKELYEQVFEKRAELLGEDHPDTARALCNLASAYANQGDYRKAKDLYGQAFEKLKKVPGEDHPDTKAVCETLRVLNALLKEDR